MNRKKSEFISYRIIFVLSLALILICILFLFLLRIVIIEQKYGIGVIFCLALFLLILYGGYHWVYKPLKETKKAFSLFSEGLILQGIFDVRYPFSPLIHHTVLRLGDMLDTKELISRSKKQTEYLALQKLLNPHLL